MAYTMIAVERRCWPHPYERLLRCRNCGAENCPAKDFCHFCLKTTGDFDARCAASWVKGEWWTYSEERGFKLEGVTA